ncbi:MAG: exodeoxyribonuclease VII small subunit [Dehalococcoidia bacterium]|nr:exodeoxyribonuclease VII small subunit [Dehalococcoidia bacterium]|tara:strand:- start:2501 stop:2734 length:234 start_codon:yes stop_codon:yes gene_type:complete
MTNKQTQNNDKDSTESFEDLMQQLETITKKLEQGGVDLDTSIALYEQGMTIAKLCQELLNKAENKIQDLHQQLDQES